MRFSLATLLLVMLSVALAVGWWIDSTRTQNEMLALRIQLQQIESLQGESDVSANAIDELETEIEHLKRWANGDNDLLQLLVDAQCRRSSEQLRALNVHERLDKMRSSQDAIPGRQGRGILKLEIRECKQVLAIVERQSDPNPKHTLQLRNQIANLETVEKKSTR